MDFDFEAYWKENGIKTNPAIMGLAFKECCQKAVIACMDHYRRTNPVFPVVRVKTTFAQHDDQYTPESKLRRKWNELGIIIAHHDSHGLCYEVRHDDGTIGCYDPDELDFYF